MQTIRDIMENKQPGMLKKLTEPVPVPAKPKPEVRETSDMRAAAEHPLRWANSVEIHVYDFPLGKELDLELELFYKQHPRAKDEKLRKLYGEDNVVQFQLDLSSQWTLEDVHVFIRHIYSNFRPLMVAMNYAKFHPQQQEGCRILRVRMNELIHAELQVIRQRMSPPRVVPTFRKNISVDMVQRGWPFNV